MFNGFHHVSTPAAGLGFPTGHSDPLFVGAFALPCTQSGDIQVRNGVDRPIHGFKRDPHQNNCYNSIYIYILFYQIGSSTLGPFKITCIRMQEPKGASLEDALPSSHWERGVGKNVLHNSNQEKTYRCFDQVAMLPEAIGNETEDYGIFFASKSWSALDCPIERRCGNHL